MTELTLWKNQQMSRLKKDVEHLFDRWWSVMSRGPAIKGMPSIDVVDGGEVLFIKAEVPGYHPEDLEIIVSDDELTVKGKRSLEGNDGGKEPGIVQSGVQSFSRTVRLPCRVDAERISAYYEAGELTVHMPKKAASGRRRIEIVVK
jgi:HSP20 family protein